MANTATSTNTTTTVTFSNLPKVGKVTVKISSSVDPNHVGNFVTLDLDLPYAGVNPLSGTIEDLSGTPIFTFTNANNGFEFREDEMTIIFNSLTVLNNDLPTAVKIILNWPDGTSNNYENIECSY